jgi:hypothetical protein
MTVSSSPGDGKITSSSASEEEREAEEGREALLRAHKFSYTLSYQIAELDRGHGRY